MRMLYAVLPPDTPKEGAWFLTDHKPTAKTYRDYYLRRGVNVEVIGLVEEVPE